jgi:hypothetical protein
MFGKSTCVSFWSGQLSYFIFLTSEIPLAMVVLTNFHAASSLISKKRKTLRSGLKVRKSCKLVSVG